MTGVGRVGQGVPGPRVVGLTYPVTLAIQAQDYDHAGECREMRNISNTTLPEELPLLRVQ